MNAAVSIEQALAQALASPDTGVPARLEAEALLSYVLGRSRSHLHARPETPLSDREAALFCRYVERRRAGEPLAHITGHREFRSRGFSVTADTLVPRPETEQLVETALERGDSLHRPVSAIDLGTGSGCIALSLAVERPHWHVLATDVSGPALQVARANAAALGAAAVRFVQSDWFEAVGEAAFDLIVSNPPYVAAGDPHLEGDGVRFEPRCALVAGADGLDAVRALLAGAGPRLRAGGFLLLEIGYDQADRVKALAREYGYRNIRIHNDLAGIPRVFAAQWDASSGR